jgi:type II secretory pathway predicted ATPase ExeA
MFLNFFHMREHPFGVTPDPRFLYLGQSHREALASLHYGIESNRGFVALIAQPGLGKTTLAFQLLEKLQQASRVVFLFQTKCNSKELFHYLLNGLGVDATGMELVSMHNKLNQILSREMVAGRRFILAIDEAQNLDPEVLEAVRLLSNFETPRHKMLQILLIGQPQLARKLASPELQQLQQRVSVFARLDPFDSEDSARYIAHRLHVAGYEGSPLFSPGALRRIAEQSQGIPRKINGLCFSALSLGCAMGRKQVDVGMIEEVIADRDVESLQRQKVARRFVSSPVEMRPAVPSLSSTRSTLTSHPAKPTRSFGQWALGAGSIVACVTIGIGILFMSPARINQLIQASSEAWTSIGRTMGPVGGFVEAKPDSGQVSSSPSVQAAGLPNTGAGQPSPSSADAGIDTVVVQPGETLRHIILRAAGNYDDITVEQFRKLNPTIANLDHIEVGQKLRLQRVPVVLDSSTASEGANTIGKN